MPAWGRTAPPRIYSTSAYTNTWLWMPSKTRTYCALRSNTLASTSKKTAVPTNWILPWKTSTPKSCWKARSGSARLPITSWPTMPTKPKHRTSPRCFAWIALKPWLSITTCLRKSRRKLSSRSGWQPSLAMLPTKRTRWQTVWLKRKPPTFPAMPRLTRTAATSSMRVLPTTTRYSIHNTAPKTAKRSTTTTKTLPNGYAMARWIFCWWWICSSPGLTAPGWIPCTLTRTSNSTGWFRHFHAPTAFWTTRSHTGISCVFATSKRQPMTRLRCSPTKTRKKPC